MRDKNEPFFKHLYAYIYMRLGMYTRVQMNWFIIT
ncbi:MAG: hypothetical protein JWN76_1590 [Chitinophagaceae bacterium]|nr:hypothetical protein [Chitinophagaceae bacterium]